MNRRLPDRPSLSVVQYQAKKLLKGYRNQEPESLETVRVLPRFRDLYPAQIAGESLTLGEAQHALALTYGFVSWAAMRAFIERPTEPGAVTLAELTERFRRLFRNGPLRSWPKKDRDLQALLALATLRLEPRKFDEKELNRVLRPWLAGFSDPHVMDHLNLRRRMVDYRFMKRSKDGSAYWPLPEAASRVLDSGAADIDLAALLARVTDDAEAKRRVHRSHSEA